MSLTFLRDFCKKFVPTLKISYVLFLFSLTVNSSWRWYHMRNISVSALFRCNSYVVDDGADQENVGQVRNHEMGTEDTSEAKNYARPSVPRLRQERERRGWT